MKLHNKIALTLGIFFSLVSCLDAEKKAHFQEIDSMVQTLDSLEKEFQSMPNDSFDVIKRKAWEIEVEVKTYFMEDTIDQEFARKMNLIRDIRKGSDFITMRRMFLDTIFAFQRAQLNTLREDIDNGVGKRDEYGNFITSERANVDIIVSSFGDYKLRFDRMRTSYYDVSDAIRERVRPFREKMQKP